MEEKKKSPFDLRKLKKENFVVIFLLGILLFVVAWPVDKKNTKSSEEKFNLANAGSGILDAAKETEGLSVSEEAGSSKELQAYTQFLEQTLEEILSTMEGAGRVKVMITLKDTGVSVVEKDTVLERASSTEVDSSGGSRNTADSTETKETIYYGGNNGAPFVKQVTCPQIEGVVVSAEGGGSMAVNKNITEAIQALFGIEVHKIKVIKMSSR